MSQKIVPIIIDMQKDFCEKGFQFDQPDKNLEPVRKAVSKTGEFLEQFEGRTVTVRTLHGDAYDNKPWENKYGKEIPCEVGTKGAELMPEIKSGTDLVVTKHGFNGFQSTNLDEILKSLGAEKVAIAGVMTNVCVEYTAQSAFNHGYEVAILEDLTASAYSGVKEETLTKIENIFCEVKSSKEFLE